MSEQSQNRPGVRSEAEVQAWLVARISKELALEPGKIDIRKPLSRFGLDSMIAVGLSAELEDWLGRELSPTLLAEHPTIEGLARHLGAVVASAKAGTPIPPGTPESAPAPRPAPDPAAWTPVQLRIRAILGILVRALCRLDHAGSFPSSGAFLLAMNHLHVLDTPVLFSLLTRPVVFFVSSHMKRFPIAKWFLSRVAHTIWVARGEADVQAIQAALAVLRGGGIVAMAPEGMISRSGGLLKGRTGAAYLASEAGVSVLPVVAWGQEKAIRNWLRFRRVPIAVRIGDPVTLPPAKTNTRQLESNTEAIMMALANLLPGEYRGLYR